MLPLPTAIRQVDRLTYSPDGTRLAAGGPTGTEVLDAASGESVRVLDWADGVVAFRPDGDSLLVAHGRRWVSPVDLQGPVVRTDRCGRPQWSQFVCLLPTSGEYLVAHAGVVVRCYFPPDGPPRYNPRLFNKVRWRMFRGQNIHPRSIAVLDDSLRVVVIATLQAEVDYHLFVLNALTGQPVAEHRCGYGTLDHFTGSLCGRWLVGVKQNAVVVWETAALHVQPRLLLNDSRKQFTGVAFVPGGRFLLTASNDRAVKCWDLPSGLAVRSYDFGVGRARSVAVAPDGLTAAVGTDAGLVVVFDLDL